MLGLSNSACFDYKRSRTFLSSGDVGGARRRRRSPPLPATLPLTDTSAAASEPDGGAHAAASEGEGDDALTLTPAEIFFP